MEEPKNNVDEQSELKPEHTNNPQVAALIEAHKKLVDEAPIKTDDDLLEATAAMLKAIQNKFAAKTAPKDSNSQPAAPMTETGAVFHEVTAKLGELQNIIKPSATPLGIKGIIPKSAPETSEAQRKITTNIPPVGLQNVDEDAPEAAEPQPEKTAEEGSGKGSNQKGKNNAKNKAKRERRKSKPAQEKANPPTAEVTVTEAAAVAAGRNPHYAAEVRGRPDDLKARVLADLERCKDLGNLNKLCVVCDKPAESGCSGCNKAARYCSKECQVPDFPIHRKVCSDFAGPAADEKRQSPQHHRVLFFPAFKVKPEVCWAAFRGADTHDGWFELEHDDITQFDKVIGIPTPTKGNGQKYADFTQVLDDRLVMRPSSQQLKKIQNTNIKRSPIGHSFVTMRLVASKAAPDIADPRVLNQSINALTKPGYLRCVLYPIRNSLLV